jgi:arylsulfatase A-like enzyme
MEEIINWIPSDATIILTGDHGEEFNHGVYHHARLYDEVVRVPFYPRWTLGDTSFDGQPIRQIDIGPTIAESVGQELPEGWRGDPYHKNEERVTYVTSNPDGSPESYAARREGTQKLIYEFNVDEELTRAELYNLRADPAEMNPLSAEKAPETTHRDLRAHVERYQFNMDDAALSDIGPNVQNRLEELGYR